jgi:hypothetical protein
MVRLAPPAMMKMASIILLLPLASLISSALRGNGPILLYLKHPRPNNNSQIISGKIITAQIISIEAKKIPL